MLSCGAACMTNIHYSLACVLLSTVRARELRMSRKQMHNITLSVDIFEPL